MRLLKHTQVGRNMIPILVAVKTFEFREISCRLPLKLDFASSLFNTSLPSRFSMGTWPSFLTESLRCILDCNSPDRFANQGLPVSLFFFYTYHRGVPCRAVACQRNPSRAAVSRAVPWRATIVPWHSHAVPCVSSV